MGGYYRHLRDMYDYLDVRYHVQPFLFNFARVANDDNGLWNAGLPVGRGSRKGDIVRSYFVHATNNHRIPPMRPSGRGILAWLVDLIYVIVCYAWWTVCCGLVEPRLTTLGRKGGGRHRSESLREYLWRIRMPWGFVEKFLLPLICAVSTCSHEELLDFPASDVVRYKNGSHSVPSFLVSGGVNSIQEKLIQGLDVRFGATITNVKKKKTSGSSGGLEVTWQEQERTTRADADDYHDDDDHDEMTVHPKSETFDQVILAVSPDIISKVYPYPPLTKSMTKIPTTTVESLVQLQEQTPEEMKFDTYSLPIYPPSASTPTPSQTIHLHSNRHATTSIHSIPPSNILITTRPIPISTPQSSASASSSSPSPSPSPSPPKAKTLHKAHFTRVLRTPESQAIINDIFSEEESNSEEDFPSDDDEKFDHHHHSRRRSVQSRWRNGTDGVWLVGGWCWDGLVLLEGCVVSAARVARGLDVRVPWEDQYSR